MKGPRSRHRFCVWRVWECPACHQRVSTPVQTVNCVCECQGKDRPTWMNLIEESRVRPPKSIDALMAPTEAIPAP